VDLRVRQETTLLAQHDEVLKPRAARLHVIGQSVELLLLDFLDFCFLSHSQHSSLLIKLRKNRKFYPKTPLFQSVLTDLSSSGARRSNARASGDSSAGEDTP